MVWHRWRVKKKLTEGECFAYRLCLALGKDHPDRLLSSLTYRQWLGWRKYYGQEPWGETRADMRSLVLSQYINAPHLPAGYELPEATYPYWEDTSPEGIAAKVDDHKAWIEQNRAFLDDATNRKTRRSGDERHESA